jgi:hypothetical protein
VHRSDFPTVLTQSGQVTGGEAGPVLSLLSDKLYSLRGDSSRKSTYAILYSQAANVIAPFRGEPAPRTTTARSPYIMQPEIKHREFVWQNRV